MHHSIRNMSCSSRYSPSEASKVRSWVWFPDLRIWNYPHISARACSQTQQHLPTHPRSIPCPSKAKLSHKWPLFFPHLMSAVCCLSDKSLRFRNHRTEVVGALVFILSLLTNYVFVSILQVWNTLSGSLHTLKFLKLVNWEERRAQGKVPALTKWEHYLS